MILLENIFDSLTDEELKEKIEAELKENIKEVKKSLKSKNLFTPIDKFTKIDDLLRENIKQQHLTNQLLLALYYKKEKDGKIIPIQPNGINTSAIFKGLKFGDDYQTLNPILNGVVVDGSQQILTIEGSGIIDVIKFVSSTANANNKSYGVSIQCDKNLLYKNTFTELEARTPNERGMVFYEDTIKLVYIGMFKTISYTKGFKIEVYDSKATFSMIQIKYHKKV